MRAVFVLLCVVGVVVAEEFTPPPPPPFPFATPPPPPSNGFVDSILNNAANGIKNVIGVAAKKIVVPRLHVCYPRHEDEKKPELFTGKHLGFHLKAGTVNIDFTQLLDGCTEWCALCIQCHAMPWPKNMTVEFSAPKATTITIYSKCIKSSGKIGDIENDKDLSSSAVGVSVAAPVMLTTLVAALRR